MSRGKKLLIALLLFVPLALGVSQFGPSQFGQTSTDIINVVGRLLYRTVSDGGMDATAGTQKEMVYNTADNLLYFCTATGSPATWLSVTGSGGITALTGDVTATGPGSAAATIASNAVTSPKILDGAVTLADQADMATASVVYRKTGGAGPPEVNTIATLKTDMGLGSAVAGPGSSTDNHLAAWNGTGGSVLKDTPVGVNPSTGSITTPGIITSGDGTGVAFNILNGADSNNRFVQIKRGGSLRWNLGTIGDAESTGDAGTGFDLFAAHDNGTSFDQVLHIDRAAGGTIVSTRPLSLKSFWANGASGTYRGITAQTAGADRMFIGVNDTPETGSDSGSKVEWDYFLDVGTREKIITVVRADNEAVHWLHSVFAQGVETSFLTLGTNLFWGTGTYVQADMDNGAAAITQLHGDGSATGPGDAALTIPTLVGDSGSGGTKGLAPAPASGDAAAGKFLKADGTWDMPAGGGGGSYDPSAAGVAEASKAVTLDVSNIFNVAFDPAYAFFTGVEAKAYNLADSGGNIIGVMNSFGENNQTDLPSDVTGSSEAALDSSEGGDAILAGGLAPPRFVRSTFMVKVTGADAVLGHDMTLRLRTGNAQGDFATPGTQIFSSGALTVITGDYVMVEYELNENTAGTAMWVRYHVTGTIGGVAITNPWIGSASTVAFDSTANNFLTPTVQWSSTSASNLATMIPGHNLFNGG